MKRDLPSQPALLAVADAPAVAKPAGLRYVNDGAPGIMREPDGAGLAAVLALLRQRLSNGARCHA
jgi:DNA topoisomerase-1